MAPQICRGASRPWIQGHGRRSFSPWLEQLGRYVWLMLLRGLIIGIPIFVCAFAVAIGAGLLSLISKGNENPRHSSS